MQKPFCVCDHSYWSHHYGMYNALGKPDRINGTLRFVCERIHCGCLDYEAEDERSNT